MKYPYCIHILSKNDILFMRKIELLLNYKQYSVVKFETPESVK